MANLYWFILVAIYVVMYLFNGSVPAKPEAKVAVNILAILGVVILALFAGGAF